jgi:hypothetical protein
MALVAGQSRYYELVATVANALAHHGTQVPFPEAAAHLARSPAETPRVRACAGFRSRSTASQRRWTPRASDLPESSSR